MALDPRISMAVQPLNLQQAIMGGLQIGQGINNARNQGIRDAILNNQAASTAQELITGQQKQQINQQTIEANKQTSAITNQNQAIKQASQMHQGLSRVASLPVEQIAGGLARMAQIASDNPNLGLDPQAILNIPPDKAAIQEHLAALGSFFQSPSLPVEIGKIDISNFTPESIANYAKTGDIGLLQPNQPISDENKLNIQKETRSEIRSTVGDLSKESSVLSTNWKKLGNLADEMRKGNRAAVSQGLVSLVKLGDPTSVVKEAEMEAALNKESPLAAVASLLSAKGTPEGVISSVIQKIDPLNPSNVNVDDLLSTASAMLKPNIESIQARFLESRTRADEILTLEGANSIFTGGIDKRVGGLTDLIPKETTTTQNAGAQFTSPSGINYTVK